MSPCQSAYHNFSWQTSQMCFLNAGREQAVGAVSRGTQNTEWGFHKPLWWIQWGSIKGTISSMNTHIYLCTAPHMHGCVYTMNAVSMWSGSITSSSGQKHILWLHHNQWEGLCTPFRAMVLQAKVKMLIWIPRVLRAALTQTATLPSWVLTPLANVSPSVWKTHTGIPNAQIYKKYTYLPFLMGVQREDKCLFYISPLDMTPELHKD